MTKEKFLQLYKKLPVPSPKDESWKYTNIQNLNFEKYKPGKQDTEFSGLSNGFIDKGVIFCTLDKARKEHTRLYERYKPMSLFKENDKFTAMHGAFCDNGVFIYIPQNIIVSLKNIFRALKGAVYSHTIIILEENSSLTYSEEHLSENHCFRNDIVEIYAQQNSRLNFLIYQNWGDVIGLNTVKAVLNKNSKVDYIFGQFGGRLSRVKIDTIFNGEGSDSVCRGVFFSNNEQHFDITTNAIHNVPNTINNILVKGVLDDKSSCVYRGKIQITEKAQQTNSYLSNHSMMLSSEAVSYSVPSLQIDANDVRASHGATIAKPNAEEIFYLMSRGLPKKIAERLIITGYFSPIINKIADNNLKDKFMQAIKKKVG